MRDTSGDTVATRSVHGTERKKQLTIGGYGEATYKRAFYSNNYLRYTSPERYRNDSYGEFDLPHVCIWMGYSFGKGWSLGSEIEFEHGGTESAIEIEEEEGGEYEAEIERGGEVALEQLWIEKRFNPMVALRAGMIVVPLGGTNAHHEPNQFFGVYRPEGENTILPCTWHEVGIQLSGRYKWLQYTAQLLPGLESARFSKKNWIQAGSASQYEFKLANTYAGLARLDFYPLQTTQQASVGQAEQLRIGLSAYEGTSFKNNLTPTANAKYRDVHGLVSLIGLDWNYQGHGIILRGSGVYGHLSDAEAISAFNKQMSKNSVSKRENVASDVYSLGCEIGYDLFHTITSLHEAHQAFYLWGRYDCYDAQARIAGTRNYWTGRQKVSCGIDYYPIQEVVIKGEFGYGILNQNPYSTSRYNNEPYVALSVNYYGLFRL